MTLYTELTKALTKALTKGIVKCDVPWEVVPRNACADFDLDSAAPPMKLEPTPNITMLVREMERFTRNKMEDAWEDAILTAYDLGYIFDLDKDDLLARNPYGDEEF